MDVTALINEAALVDDPAERRSRLRALREQAIADVEKIDTLLREEEALREAALNDGSDLIAKARGNATLRDELILRGMATIVEMDEGGMLSHDDLDGLERDGVLEAVLGELYSEDALVPDDLAMVRERAEAIREEARAAVAVGVAGVASTARMTASSSSGTVTVEQPVIAADSAADGGEPPVPKPDDPPPAEGTDPDGGEAMRESTE